MLFWQLPSYQVQKQYLLHWINTSCIQLKIQFRETVDYEKVIEQAKRDKIDYEYRMDVIPISFNEWGKELLGRFQHVVSKSWFLISADEHKELITQMRIAKFKDNGNLDKGETSNNTYDVFDSARLALKMFEMNQFTFPNKSMN